MCLQRLLLPFALALAGCGQAVSAASDTGANDDAPRSHTLAPGSSTAHLNPCFYGYPAQARDAHASMPEVLAWLRDNSWQAAHAEWHAIRACSQPGGHDQSQVSICRFRQLVPQDQHCQSAGDGYQSLVFHRYLLQAMKQMWPRHAEPLAGFSEFPTSAYDVPAEWRSAWKSWGPELFAAGKIADEIAKPDNLARFPDEGTLGFWLQCNLGEKLWARPGHTTHGAGNGEANMDDYMFWKLHGWMDNVWEKYRVAKGLTPTNQQLKDDLAAQCQELHTEIRIIEHALEPYDVPDPNGPLPHEAGFFHERVRPIFASQTNLCVSCHAETGTNANLRLGGRLTSKEIVAGLVNRPSDYGGQYKLVVPGDPEHSWLYLKAAGTAADANCQPGTAPCVSGVMPPSSGPTLSAAELRTLHQWIVDGAAGPP